MVFFQHLKRVLSRHSQAENEVRTIASVSDDGMTLTLTEGLEYTHLGVSVALPGGKVLEGRAEVGLLTRNVVVRGSQNMDWAEKIEACPDGFNTGTVEMSPRAVSDWVSRLFVRPNRETAALEKKS